MKIIKMMAIIALVFNVAGIDAKCNKFASKELSVERFTDAGNGEVRWEQGTLLLKQGFIPITSSNLTLGTFDLTPALVSQINGQTVIPLSLWTSFEGSGGSIGTSPLCNFSRSVATFSINSVPYVLVSTKEASTKKPKVSISAVDPSASETAGDTGQFMITLNAPSNRTIRVKLEATGGKAKKNRDFTGIPKSVVIPSGNVSAIVEVLPIDDTEVEGPEDVKVKVSSGDNAYSALVGGRGKASLIINDND